jgi:hypothetical protein
MTTQKPLTEKAGPRSGSLVNYTDPRAQICLKISLVLVQIGVDP